MLNNESIVQRLEKEFPNHTFSMRLCIDGSPSLITWTQIELIDNPKMQKAAEEILYESIRENVIKALDYRNQKYSKTI